MGCNCNKKPGNDSPIHSSTPSTKAVVLINDAIITKKTCPKCQYWMALTVYPVTKEKKFVCQSNMCNYSMVYVPL